MSQPEWRTLEGTEVTSAFDEGAEMADKSPRQTMSKKSGKSIKQKRMDKKAKAAKTSATEKLTDPKRH
jgi:hypothetical protein